MSIQLKNVRFSYCSLFQPQARPGQDPKYSVTILIPKTNAAAKAAADQAVQEAIAAGVSKCWNGQRPPAPSICVHDGDGPRPSDGQPYGEECRGCWVFTASSKHKPTIVDARVQDIINATEVYSGMWGNVFIEFFPYNSNGKKGIGCELMGVQKVRDGEPLAGKRPTAEKMFQDESAAIPPDSTAGGWGAPTAFPPIDAWSAYAAPGGVNPFTGQPMGY